MAITKDQLEALPDHELIALVEAQGHANVYQKSGTLPAIRLIAYLIALDGNLDGLRKSIAARPGRSIDEIMSLRLQAILRAELASINANFAEVFGG